MTNTDVAEARPVTKRVAIQLTEDQVDVLTVNTALLPQQGLRTISRVVQALIADAEQKGSWKRILKNAA